MAQYIKRTTSHDFRITDVEKVLAEVGLNVAMIPESIHRSYTQHDAELEEKLAPKKRKGGSAAAKGKVRLRT